MKRHHYILLPAKIAQTNLDLLPILHRRQLKIGRYISYLQSHRNPPSEHSTTNIKAALVSRPFLRTWFCGLRRLYILGLPPLGPLDYIELHLLAFLQATESVGLDCREVHEHVFAILAADETIPFGVVKPLYCSCFHGVA